MELIPGVQAGERLTLTGVNDRIGRVEEVVAKLAEDFYGTPDAPITQAEVEKVAIQPSSFVDGGCVTTCLGDCRKPWIDQSDRIKELELVIATLTEERAELEEKVADAEHDRKYWHSEYNEAQSELDDIRGKLAGLI